MGICLAGATGCSTLLPPGPTEVAQGKYYGSGDAEFDQFFIDLYRAQLHAASLPARVTQTRATLTDGLTVSRELSTGAVIEHVRARAEELQKQNVLMKLDVRQPTQPGQAPTAVLLTRPSVRGARTRELAEPVERSFNELLALAAVLDAATTELARLDTRRDALRAKTSKTFFAEGPGKVGEVERNLDDARRVIALMRERVATYVGDTSALVTGLGSAVDTARGAFDRTEPPDEVPPEPARTNKKPGRSSGAARPAALPKASAPKPAPKPVPPSSSAGDAGGFEP